MGAGQNIIWVCPSLELVVVNSPGAVLHSPNPEEILLPQQLARIVAACRCWASGSGKETRLHWVQPCLS